MQQYWSDSGNAYCFLNRVVVSRLNDKMIEWCLDYVSDGRFYIGLYDGPTGAVFQFESEEPAIMFNLKFGGK